MADGPNLFDHVTCPTCQGKGLITDAQMAHYLNDRPGRFSSKGPETSVKAATQTPPRFGSQRYNVMKVLARHGPSTAAEVALLVGLSRNQTATRLGELREGGFVAYERDDKGDIVERSTGRADTGFVQMLTPLGRAALHQEATRGT